MNEAKIISICNRIRVLPPHMRPPVVAELLFAIDEGPGYRANKAAGVTKAVGDLRDALTWLEVRETGYAMVRFGAMPQLALSWPWG